MSNRTAITIGNFDGVHLGHQALIATCLAAAGEAGRVVVLAFDPHPVSLLRPGTIPRRLSRFEQRQNWIAELGEIEVIRLEPTPALLNQSPEEYVSQLVSTYRPSVIVEGPDFRFGRGRAGSIETLRELGQRHDFEVISIPPVEAALRDQSVVRVSSSIIRWLVGHGRMSDATTLLGRPYEIVCTVVPGERRGRALGVPTINLDHADYQLPADGVYGGVAGLPDGSKCLAAISVGTKPTFGDKARVCEAHLINYSGPFDHYQWIVRLQIHEWLREQYTFSTVDALIEQLHRDCRSVLESISLSRGSFAAMHQMAQRQSEPVGTA